MITTVCLHPALDHTVTLDSLQIGSVHRASAFRIDAGGKGINVALVLHSLGTQAQCVWCAPTQGGSQLQAALEARGLRHFPIAVPGAVRTNLKLVSREGTTDINEVGAPMDEASLQKVYDTCLSLAKDSQCMVLTGSLPSSCPKGTYAELIRRLPIPAVLDVSGDELILGLSAKPFLIKPNNEELEKTLGIRISTRDDIICAAKKLMSLGAQNILVSLGKDGAMLFTEDVILHSGALDVPVRSTVGAGDAMIAGMLYGLEKTGSLRDAFPYGVAAGSAAVTMEGTQPFEKEDFLRLLSQVNVQEVS